MERKKRANKRRRLSLQILERRDLLAADPFGTNDLQPLDVGRDGAVTALDALRVINALNRASVVNRSDRADPSDSPGMFIDVNGDGAGTTLDVLRIINALTRQSPIIAATLRNDTAPANSTNLDLVTSDYSLDLSVSVGDLGDERVRLRVGEMSESSLVDITERFEGNRATLSSDDIDEILGQELSDGDHRFQVQLGSNEIEFVLSVDHSPPEISLDLDSDSDTGARGDGVTTLGSVDLRGQSEPNALVVIERLGLEVISDASGGFQFSNGFSFAR